MNSSDVMRLLRVEVRPAGRGVSIVHEVDEVHPYTESCDICDLLRGRRPEALNDPLAFVHRAMRMELTTAEAVSARLGGKP